MGRIGRGLRTRRVGVSSLSAVIVLTTLLGAIASPSALAAATPEPPVIPDGAYQGVIVGSSTVDAGPMTGIGSFNGQMTFSVDAGAVTGTYEVKGTSVLSGPDAHGTGRYVTTGTVTGTAAAPEMVTGVTTIEATMTIGGSTNTQTMEMPGGDSSTLMLTGGDCGVLIAQWHVSVAGMTGDGTVVIMPTIDMTPDQSDYLSEALAVQDDVDAYTAALAAGTAATVDPTTVMERASALRRSMQRNEECGLRPSDDVVDIVLTNAISAMLEAALAHPEGISDTDLGALTAAAAEHGVVGADSPGGGANELGDGLVAEWQQRLDRSVMDNNALGVDQVAIAAEVLGDAGLREDAAAAEETVGD